MEEYIDDLLRRMADEENKDEITNICYTLLEVGTNQSILPLTKLYIGIVLMFVQTLLKC
ncbi:hypothetical protein bcere0007_7130 [Bacillus mycoides]|uniref:Uncharacterized protein n=1 Tax=Bacillus cereus VD048 TaxID=1053226 RepID=J8EDK9_BACCE|nr:hypothetical protein bcere0007_7130 [Bacillus mycoides]EJR29064.1 hypothetical protein IIG_04071 [Bacillus cereus VD048]